MNSNENTRLNGLVSFMADAIGRLPCKWEELPEDLRAKAIACIPDTDKVDGPARYTDRGWVAAWEAVKRHGDERQQRAAEIMVGVWMNLVPERRAHEAEKARLLALCIESYVGERSLSLDPRDSSLVLTAGGVRDLSRALAEKARQEHPGSRAYFRIQEPDIVRVNKDCTWEILVPGTHTKDIMAKSVERAAERETEELEKGETELEQFAELAAAGVDVSDESPDIHYVDDDFYVTAEALVKWLRWKEAQPGGPRQYSLPEYDWELSTPEPTEGGRP